MCDAYRVVYPYFIYSLLYTLCDALQVEISTHVGPHRRLWMGPQFTFHAYQGNIGGADGDAPFHENGDVINELRHAKLV